MSVPAVYLPEAEKDIQTAYDDYERARAGLGDRFADAVRGRIDVSGMATLGLIRLTVGRFAAHPTTPSPESRRGASRVWGAAERQGHSRTLAPVSGTFRPDFRPISTRQ